MWPIDSMYSFNVYKKDEAGGREVKGGSYAEGSSLPSGSNPAPLQPTTDKAIAALNKALGADN